MTRVTLAAIAGAHGIGGEVRLKLFAQSLDSFAAHRVFEAAGRSLTLKSIRPDKAGAVARFAEIADRTAAEALRGTPLTIDRAQLPPLPEGEYYHVDLIGLAVVSTAGTAVGTVIAVENFGAGDILEIKAADGRTFMVPFNPAAVHEVGATVTIDLNFAD